MSQTSGLLMALVRAASPQPIATTISPLGLFPLRRASSARPTFTFRKPRNPEQGFRRAYRWRLRVTSIANRVATKKGTATAMQLITGLIYCVAVIVWLAVLGTVVYYYVRNPRIFGTSRLLLLVIVIDTVRNLVENVYFGLFFGGQYGFFPAAMAISLGDPAFVILPKVLNIAAGCFVLGLLLMRWLPEAVRERNLAERVAIDLGQLATTDGLTSLINRRHFDALAHAEWARFQRYGRPLSLMLLDIDHFKSVNDRFGHDAGDMILKAVAEICKLTKRQSDVVARFGGEEFVLLLPETDETAAEIAAERLRKSIQDHPRILPGENLQVTVSIGVAGAALGMAAFEVMFKLADEALYEAKRSGRNRVVRTPRMMTEIHPIAAE
jgi:diguanylate cyclase (GGDEF)-like protein